MEPAIRQAAKEDLTWILAEAGKFDLDTLGAEVSQFLILSLGKEKAGFGRIIEWPDFSEMATLGILEQHQKKGFSKPLIEALTEKAAKKVFLVTVLPEVFRTSGFQVSEEKPETLRPKINFCKEFNFEEHEVFIMEYSRHG